MSQFDFRDSTASKKKTRRGFGLLWILLPIGGGLGLAVLVCCGAGAFLFLNDGGRDEDARSSARSGDVQITVKSARTGNFSGRSPSGQFIVSSDRAIIITLELSNANASRRVRYGGWGLRTDVRLHDDRGNYYQQKQLLTEFGLQADVSGQLVGGAAIPPGASVTDVLVFVPPDPGVQYLILTLPGDAIGAWSPIKLRISHETWEPPHKPPSGQKKR